MSLNAPITLRPAGPSDWPAIQRLLLAHQLPTAGAQDHLATTLLALHAGEVVGCAGAEVYGSIALLRSVAVAPGLQRQGIGRTLVERLLHEARARDIATLYLLTVTAPEYFAAYGFKRLPVEQAPAALKASAEFQGACPACAALMALPLREVPTAPGDLPVAVLGAGPVGLAALAQLLERGLPAVVLEAGATVGAHLVDYGHVQLFSPWRFNVDPAMARLLAPTGWQAPPADVLPRAAEVVAQVLQPFADLPAAAACLRRGARVTGISREGLDKVKTGGRDRAAFVVHYQLGGQPRTLRARAVIDATGTWGQPNPSVPMACRRRVKRERLIASSMASPTSPAPSAHAMPGGTPWWWARAIQPPMRCWRWPTWHARCRARGWPGPCARRSCGACSAGVRLTLCRPGGPWVPRCAACAMAACSPTTPGCTSRASSATASNCAWWARTPGSNRSSSTAWTRSFAPPANGRT